jgi:hypothetical protein
VDFTLFRMTIAASRSAHLGGTVATVGFPDPAVRDQLRGQEQVFIELPGVCTGSFGQAQSAQHGGLEV